MRRTQTQSAGELLQEIFSKPHIAAKLAEGRLPDVWAEVVGGHVAQLTESIRLENHVMYVRITSSVVRHEVFLRRDLLTEKINAALGMKLVNVLIIK